ncbi:MAG: molybdenum cofactor guanylyltransferase [Thermotogaceae bacterium]|nr:molybdenum cofactor guanylyltransferase [Thermotogaceae bacterium]
MNIAILCGGKGRRIGNVNKGLLTVCGKTFVEILYDELRELGEVYIIGRKEDFKSLEIPAFADILPNLGPLGGIYTALSIAKSEYVLLVPCDMPTFKKEHALFLEEILLDYHADIALFYTDRITPIPGIYQTILKDTVRERLLSNNLSLTDLIKTQKTVVAVVRDLGKLKNINTKEDYYSLVNSVICQS